MTHGNLELQFLRKELLKLRQEIALRPIGAPSRGGPYYPPLAQVIGGQTVLSVPMLQYVSDPYTLTGYYDPTIDTTYQVGLGYGDLYDTQGHPARKINIRHVYTGFTDPYLGGNTVIVGPPISMTITTTNAPPGSPVTGQKYTVGAAGSGAWSGHNNATATWNGAAWVFTAAPPTLVISAYPIIRG